MVAYRYKPPLELALELVLGRFCHPGPAERIPLEQAQGRVAAGDVVAPAPFPHADLSMMDGLAYGTAGPAGKLRPVLTGEELGELAAGVVPHEEVDRAGGDPSIWSQNIVRCGGEYRAGEIIVRSGEVIRHGHLSQLALLGIAAVLVYRRPQIGVGVFSARPRADAIRAWLAGFLGGCYDVDVKHESLADTTGLAPLAAGADLVLAVSDGSPGRYDQMKSGLLGGDSGFEPLFWKLDLNPCRHVGAGVIGTTPVLVLPDVFFKTAVSAMAFWPPLMAAWVGGRPATTGAIWDALPEPRYSLPCLVPLRFAAGLTGSGGCPRAVALPLVSSFSAREVVDAEGFVVLEEPPQKDEVFEAVVLGRLQRGA